MQPRDEDAAGSTKYCLKWNNFGLNVTTSFKALLENEEFVDISLSAQGRTLKAHKVVLSASSQYFRDILQDIPSWQHPVILLRDVPFDDLQGIVEFIYHGEVSVDQESLTSFLKTAHLLRVKGLTDEAAAAAAAVANNKPPIAVATKEEEEIDDVEDEEEELDDEEEEEEIVWGSDMHQIPSVLPTPPAVAETVPRLNSGGDGGGSGGGHHQHHQRKSANPKRAVNKSNACISEEDGIFAGEIDDREEEEIAAVQQQTQAAAAAAAAAAADMMKHFMQLQPPLMFSPTGGPDMKHPKEEKVDQDLEERAMHIDGKTSHLTIAEPTSNSTTPPPGLRQTNAMSQKKTCPYCQQQLSWHALSRHVRDMHRNNKTGFVTCKVCGKMFRNKNSLGCHMWRFHKDNKQQQQATSSKDA